MVAEKSASDERVEALLGVVEGLRQEVKSLKVSVQALVDPMQAIPVTPGVGPSPHLGQTRVPAPKQDVERMRGCWECGCNRHIRRDCPYLQGN